jgi:hypothetical protein
MKMMKRVKENGPWFMSRVRFLLTFYFPKFNVINMNFPLGIVWVRLSNLSLHLWEEIMELIGKRLWN